MKAFAIKVKQTNDLNYSTAKYFEKGELGVSATGRLVHISRSAMLESQSLANDFSDEVRKNREAINGEVFDSEIIEVSMSDRDLPDFRSRVKEDTYWVKAKLAKQ